MTLHVPTDEDIEQIAAWYADPVRKLPRKVVRDVKILAAEVVRLREERGDGGYFRDVDRARRLSAEQDLAALETRSHRWMRQADELRHAVGHALDCDQGTVLCNDCKRMLRAAMKVGVQP